jgi:hypothetical protein
LEGVGGQRNVLEEIFFKTGLVLQVSGNSQCGILIIFFLARVLPPLCPPSPFTHLC